MAQYQYEKVVRADQLTAEINASTITIALSGMQTDGVNSLTISFKADLPNYEKTILDNLVTAHIPQPIPEVTQPVAIISDVTTKLDSDGIRKVSMQPTIGSNVTVITHNFADPCTWYTKSIQVVDEILTAYGGYVEYSAIKQNIIDIEHGRITFDDRVDQKYCIQVKKNGTVITTGFSCNYELGTIIFTDTLTSNDAVTMSYYYATDSDFVIAAVPGKKLKSTYVEVQVSENVALKGKTHIYFEEWGYNPSNLPNKMCYKTTIYKCIDNFIDESNNSDFSVVPPMDGQTKGLHIFVWNYTTARVIKSSQGAEVRVYLKDFTTGNKNVPVRDTNGNKVERVTAAFYCLSEAE